MASISSENPIMKNILKFICLAVFLINIFILPQFNYITYSPPERLSSEDLLNAWALDFSQYYSAALTLRQGKDFYDTNLIYEIGKNKGAFNSEMDYLYPPFFLFFIIPLTFFPFKLASIIWLSLNQLLVVFLIFLSLRIFKVRNKLVIWLAFGLVGLFYPVFFGLRLGQADLIMSLFVYLGVYFILNKKNVIGSTLYSLGCCIKLTPVIFIIYFLKKRLFKIAIISSIVILIIITASNLLVDKEVASNYLFKTFPSLANSDKFMELSRQNSAKRYLQLNQSLGSLVEKSFLLKTGLKNYKDNLSTIKKYSLLLRLTVLALVFYLLNGGSAKPEIMIWEISILIVTILLVNSGSFFYHFSILILPLCGALNFLFDNYKKISSYHYTLFLISFPILGFRLGYRFAPIDSIFLFWGSSKLIGLILFLYLLISIYRYNLQHNLPYEQKKIPQK